MSPEPVPHFDLATAQAAIVESNRRFEAALAHGDAAGLAACYSPDACLYAPHLPAFRGRDAIRSFFEGAMAQGVRAATLTTVEVLGGPAGVTEVGTLVLRDAEGGEVDRGRYLVHWQLIEGRWRMHRDIFHSELPARRL